MTALLRLFLLTLLLASPLAQADIRVIQLQHRTDTDMIRLLQPLLAHQERVVGNGQQLILQAGNAIRLDELEQLAGTLDTPLRRLLITLDSGTSGISHESGIEARGRIRGRSGEVTLGQPGTGGNRVDIRHYSTSEQDGSLRTIQTLEGSAAFIRTGQQIPQQQWVQDHRGRGQLQTIQRELGQGFYVTPFLQGSRVTLELDSHNDSIARNNPRITEQQSLSTRVSGFLDEWISVGEIGGNNQYSNSGISAGMKSYSNKTSSLRIKVQLLDE